MLVLKILKYDNSQKLDFKKRILKVWSCVGIKTLYTQIRTDKPTFEILVVQELNNKINTHGFAIF